MSASRIFSVAAVAAFASFAAQADTYGAHFQDEVQSTRTRAEVHAEAVKAAHAKGVQGQAKDKAKKIASKFLEGEEDVDNPVVLLQSAS